MHLNVISINSLKKCFTVPETWIRISIIIVFPDIDFWGQAKWISGS